MIIENYTLLSNYKWVIGELNKIVFNVNYSPILCL